MMNYVYHICYDPALLYHAYDSSWFPSILTTKCFVFFARKTGTSDQDILQDLLRQPAIHRRIGSLGTDALTIDLGGENNRATWIPVLKTSGDINGVFTH